MKKQSDSLNKTEHVDLSQYAPEVESRRANYDRLAEAFSLLASLECQTVDFDMEVPDLEGEFPMPLVTSMANHIRLVFDQLDWLDPQTIRRFYTEMRLWADQKQWEQNHSRLTQEQLPAWSSGDASIQ